MNEKRQIIKLALLVLGITMVYGLTFVLSEFIDSPCSGAKDFFIQLLGWTLVESFLFVLLWALAANKYVFAAIFPIITLLSAVATYFRYTMDVTVTPMTIDLITVNDMPTTLDMITPPLVITAALAVAAAVVAVAYRFRKISIRRSWLHFLAGFFLLFMALQVGRIAQPVVNRIPFNIYASVKEYLLDHRISATERPQMSAPVVCSTDSIDIVFIIGETLRAKNMQINGYQRQTTPLLCRERNAVALPNIYSEYTLTHESVPYIMTRADHSHPERAYEERSFISLFRKAGFSTTWIANQESVPTFIYFMKEADSLIYINGGKSLYMYTEWADGDVLPALKGILNKKDAPARRLTIIHTIGSHWWYRAHYTRPFARWKPELRSRTISQNSTEEFVNSYDNTVLYSDWFWNEVRNMLRERNAMVIYLSDHGENLGENGFHGHINETPALHNPGCWIWFSDCFEQLYPQKTEALRRNREKAYNSAFLFHSILSAGDITTKYVEKEYDIFR